MPKVHKKYEKFSDGLNSSSEARDLIDSEFADVKNMAFDQPGKIRTIGNLSTYVAADSPPVAHCGYGLFSFGADYDMDSPPNADESLYIANCDTATGASTRYIRIYGDHGGADAWANDIAIGSPKTPYLAVYYYANGALRVYDANFNDDSNDMVLRYIKRTDFPGSGNTTAWDGWYSSEISLDTPTRGLQGLGVYDSCDDDVGATNTNLMATGNFPSTWNDELDSGVYIAINTTDNQARIITARVDTDNLTTEALTGTWRTDTYRIFAPEDTGVCFHTYLVGYGGTWSAQTIIFAQSWLYVNDQESLLYVYPGSLTLVDNDYLGVRPWLVKPTNENIIGSRVYYKKNDSDGSWSLLFELRWTNGFRHTLASGWEYTTNWENYVVTGSGDAPSNDYMYPDNVVSGVYLYESEPTPLSYEAINGYSPDEISINSRFKWVTVGNNRAWGFYAKRLDANGNEVEYGDRIYYTPPLKYDTWPDSFYINLTPQDGDNFTAGYLFADRLFAFKKRKMYVINVGSGNDTEWYLESEHDGLGIYYPAAIFKTDFGIIWVNDNGCYFYNGESITNIIEKQRGGVIEPVIDRATWATFITNNAIIGYDPQFRQVLVIGDGTSATGNFYLYDMATGGWTKGTKFAQASGSYTNFVVHDNNLLIGDST